MISAAFLFLYLVLFGSPFGDDDEDAGPDGGGSEAAALAGTPDAADSPTPQGSPVPTSEGAGAATPVATPEASSLSCSAGGLSVTLRRDRIAAFDNGFGQVDAIVEAEGFHAEPVFSVADNPAIEAVALVSGVPDDATPGEFDVYIDRTDDGVFPLGSNDLTFVTTVGPDSCGIPITLEVSQYAGGQ